MWIEAIITRILLNNRLYPHYIFPRPFSYPSTHSMSMTQTLNAQLDSNPTVREKLGSWRVSIHFLSHTANYQVSLATIHLLSEP